jgi:hypothetical protein
MADDQARGLRVGLGPKLARARTPAGSLPSVTVPQHGQAFACATYSVTFGAGAGATSATW